MLAGVGSPLTQRKVARRDTESSAKRGSQSEFPKCPINVLKGYPPVIPARVPSAVPAYSGKVAGGSISQRLLCETSRVWGQIRGEAVKFTPSAYGRFRYIRELKVLTSPAEKKPFSVF